MVRVGIVGATGYGARELLRLITAHPEAEVVAVTSESAVGKPLTDVHPAFGKLTSLVCEPFSVRMLAELCDVVFVAVPATKSMEFVSALRKSEVSVIDIGPDFRLKSADLFKQHYKADHVAPDLLSQAVYGLPIVNRRILDTAVLVAVPGCYPISIITPLKPLLGAPLADIPIVIDSISGISGAGKSLSDTYHFPEMNENVRAYNLATHRHVPEIEQALENKVMVQFNPHVGPYTRGILSTLTVRTAGKIAIDELYACYADEPFVRVLGEGKLPELKYVRGTNFCDVGWVMDKRTGNLIIVSAIDNLVGGTAGIAIQCMNLMFGLDEKTGLQFGGMAP
jgi:N-acetyl-gamma-glutamyl-phosphate reductase